ncbi:MAG: hypothetical protein PHY02_08625 [Phycisphaerae bacterium]|nr:hypothetical protein [Phycisphaerae bacterium]
MPVTPYHFGPSVFLGLIFRKWLDVPVFVLANVIVDIEVLVISLLGLGWPMHRYAHTILIGAVVGAVWGIAAYPFRHLFGKIMQMLLIPYRTGFWKMVVSGVLGVWLHVVIDALYHWDVLIFWPSKVRPLWRLMSQWQVKIWCVVFFVAAVIVYLFTAASYVKQNKVKRAKPY